MLFVAVLAVVMTKVLADPTPWMWSDPFDRPAATLGPYEEPARLTFDPLCFCEYTWLGPHGYYNYWTLDDITYATYHDADHWDPYPHIEIIPCKVCYVTIQGANTVFIDEDTQNNDMYIGGNKWDDTTVILGHLEGLTVLTLGMNSRLSLSSKVFFFHLHCRSRVAASSSFVSPVFLSLVSIPHLSIKLFSRS